MYSPYVQSLVLHVDINSALQVHPNVQFGGRKEVSESALNQPHEDQPVRVPLAEQIGRLDRKDEAAISTVMSNPSQ